MKLVYLGKKNPKVVEAEGLGASFVPGFSLEVDNKLGKILLKNASDIFRKATEEEKKALKEKKKEEKKALKEKKKKEEKETLKKEEKAKKEEKETLKKEEKAKKEEKETLKKEEKEKRPNS